MIKQNPFKTLSPFEWVLWSVSVVTVIVSFIISGKGALLEMIASVIGVTALIFVAKGMIIGQAMTVLFSIFYGIISLHFHYWGEMITYLCMSAPISFIATIEWIRHPYKNTDVVEVSRVSKKQIFLMSALAVVVTGVFYVLLKAFDTPNLFFSTISITTSFTASYLTFLRSPYYGVGYALNDVVLIVLWTLASIQDISYLPMVACFVMFLVNDVYGFINWRRIKREQKINK